MSGKILIVDGVATNRIVLKAKLASSCYQTVLAPDGASALALAQGAAPDLIVLGMDLPDIAGAEVCARLRANPATRGIPLIVTTGPGDTAQRIRALEAGADDCLTKPVDGGLLLARLRSLLRLREAEAELPLRDGPAREAGFADAPAPFEPPMRVAIVTSRSAAVAGWRAGLARRLRAAIDVLTPAGAVTLSRSSTGGGKAYDAFVIAAGAGAADDGLHLIPELRSHTATRHAALCIVLPENAREQAAMALDLGVGGVMIGPVDPCEMALRLRLLLARKRQADRQRASVRDGLRLAVTDPLTGLYNRRYALPQLARIAERARRGGRPFAVMVLDLDRFKAVNDSHGHAAGDAVLVAVARRLQGSLNRRDLIARIGGEEFLVALPDTDPHSAHVTARRLCHVIEAQPVPLPGGGAQHVTLSIGLAVCDPARDLRDADTGRALQALIERADRALMDAKTDGRNQVTVSLPAA